MCNIYLVRHGETYWNKLNIMHGQCDVPLNETGKKQAENLAVELRDIHFDLCISSPLQRARATAEEILKFHSTIPIYTDDRLMELYKGKLEGTYNNSEKLLHNERLEFLQKYDVESKAHFYKRVESFYSDILSKYKDKSILIVCHSGTVKMSNFCFKPDPVKNIVESYYDLHIKNCCCQLITADKLPKEKPILIEYDVSKEEYPWISTK